MPAIRFPCMNPQCCRRLKMEANWAGKRITCPHCRFLQTVPQVSSAPMAPSSHEDAAEASEHSAQVIQKVKARSRTLGEIALLMGVLSMLALIPTGILMNTQSLPSRLKNVMIPNILIALVVIGLLVVSGVQLKQNRWIRGCSLVLACVGALDLAARVSGYFLGVVQGFMLIGVVLGSILDLSMIVMSCVILGRLPKRVSVNNAVALEFGARPSVSALAGTGLLTLLLIAAQVGSLAALGRELQTTAGKAFAGVRARGKEAKPDNPLEIDSNVKILDNPDDLPIRARVVELLQLSQFGTFHSGTKPDSPDFQPGALPANCRTLVIEWTTKDRDSFAANYRFPSLNGENCHPGGLRGDAKHYPVPALAFDKMEVGGLPIVCVIEGGPGGVVRSGFIQGGGVLKMAWPIPANCSRVTFELPERKPVQMEIK